MAQEQEVPAAGSAGGDAVQWAAMGAGESPPRAAAPVAPLGSATPATEATATPGVDPVPAHAAGAAGTAGAPPQGPTSSRRRFVTWLLGFSVVGTLALVAAPVISFLVPPRESAASDGGKTAAGTTADIPPGKGKVVAMGSKPVIVVNGDQGVKAFSAICTHLGCIVAYDDQNGTIICPCHGGKFNPQTGAVMGGPPPAPLDPVSVAVEGDAIYLVATS